MPFDFWTAERFRAPFASRNIGYVLRAYRTDPHHRETYPNGISQSRLARWLGTNQATVSNIELGRYAVDSVSRTIEIAQKIGVPRELLWLKLPADHEPAEPDAERVKLATLRQGAGLTQESFATKAGVNRSTVIRWETGETTPQPHQWYTLAKILGVSRHQLAEALTHTQQDQQIPSATEGADIYSEAKAEQSAEPGKNDVGNNSEAPRQYNELFRAARESTPSEMTPGLCISRTELAEAVNQYLSQTTGKVHTALDARHIGRIERGQIRWPSKTYRTALRAVLGVPTDSELGFYPTGAARAARANLRQSPTTPHSGATTSRAEPRIQLARVRKAEGYTQEALAHAIEVTRETVSHWEAGDWEPSPYIRPRLARALRRSLRELDQLITLEEPATNPNVPAIDIESSGTGESPASVESGDIERRSLLTATGATALEVTLASSPMRTLQALEIITADSADSLGIAIDCLNELVPYYSNSLATSSPDIVFNDLLQCRHYSSKLLQNGELPSSRRAELTVSAGWISNLLAVATSYMGDHSSAVIWCIDAERRSRESGNKDIAGWAAFTRAMIAYYQGDMNRTIQAAGAGLQVAPKRSVVRARLSSHAMRAHATQGNTADAMSAKDEATRAIAELPSTITHEGVFSIAVSEDPPYTATSLLHSGRFKEASAVTRKVLRDAYSNDQPIQLVKSSNHARTLLTLGLSEAALGNIDEAVSSGLSALDTDNLVWPTLVLAGKLNKALRRERKTNSTTVEYHNMYHDALAEYRALNTVSHH